MSKCLRISYELLKKMSTVFQNDTYFNRIYSLSIFFFICFSFILCEQVLKVDRVSSSILDFEIPENKVYIRETKDTKGTIKLINLKQTDNAMAKMKKTNKQQHTWHNIEN